MHGGFAGWWWRKHPSATECTIGYHLEESLVHAVHQGEEHEVGLVDRKVLQSLVTYAATGSLDVDDNNG